MIFDVPNEEDAFYIFGENDSQNLCKLKIALGYDRLNNR